MIPCVSVEDVVESGNLDLFFGAFCVYGTLQPQFADAGSWFTNALNWKAKADAEPERVLIVRYEDIASHGPDALLGVASRIGLQPDDLKRGFDIAKAQTKPDGKFFWKQMAGNYRNVLLPEFIERFSQLHGDTLEKFGYATD